MAESSFANLTPPATARKVIAMARFANSPYALPRMINFGIIRTDLPGHETFSDDEVSTLALFCKSLRSKKS